MHWRILWSTTAQATRRVAEIPCQAFAAAVVQGVLRLRMPIRIRESACSAQDDNFALIGINPRGVALRDAGFLQAARWG